MDFDKENVERAQVCFSLVYHWMNNSISVFWLFHSSMLFFIYHYVPFDWLILEILLCFQHVVKSIDFDIAAPRTPFAEVNQVRSLRQTKSNPRLLMSQQAIEQK